MCKQNSTAALEKFGSLFIFLTIEHTFIMQASNSTPGNLSQEKKRCMCTCNLDMIVPVASLTYNSFKLGNNPNILHYMNGQI